MHCLCKSIGSTSSSSAFFPITSNVYIACRTVGFQRLFSSYGESLTLHTLRKAGEVFCCTDLQPNFLRLGLHPFFTCSSAAAHHSYISIRGLRSAPKKNALRNPSPSSNPSNKKGKVNASKESLATTKASSKSVQAQKSSFTKPKHLETKSSLKPVQAQYKSFSRSVQETTEFSSNSFQAKTRSSSTRVKPVQAKAKDSSKQVQKQIVVDEPEDSEVDDEFDEGLDDDEDNLDNDLVEDYDDEDEDFDGEEDEDLVDELVEEDADDDQAVGEDDAFIDDMLEEEGEGVEDVVLGDGGDGGGVKISQMEWGEKALLIAKGVLEEFGDNFSLYAFKTSYDHRVYVRLDKHSDRYGSPSMVEIESFSSIYKKRLEEAGLDGTIPDNIALEVSSPGAERVIQVPDQLMRFKDLPMLVRYEEAQENESTKTSPVVKDSILQLASVETELGKSVWKLANVRANRDQAGKGRGLTKKQKEWRLDVPFSSLRLVRLYMDI